MASGHGVPHQQAGHMAAPTSLAPPSKKTLANGEPASPTSAPTPNSITVAGSRKETKASDSPNDSRSTTGGAQA
jgi:hypothetical protein